MPYERKQILSTRKLSSSFPENNFPISEFSVWVELTVFSECLRFALADCDFFANGKTDSHIQKPTHTHTNTADEKKNNTEATTAPVVGTKKSF